MPVYQFQALDAQGRTRKGTLEADTLKAAAPPELISPARPM